MRVQLGNPVPGGYIYGGLALLVGRVSNLRQYAGVGTKNDCAGKNQQQFTRPIDSEST
jgi:hypothetical protein